uniref:Uncharacterized protein n=2 Tax=Methanosarcinales TaxID=94695 RepID=A0A7G9YN63_9EURY|nr:hypothetical protein OCBBGKCP_00004 [Methanosarcinales archaeon ANME-2c ERB4]QNT35661.1 hypothetical protein GNCGGNMO_00023 [uncultured Methanosarcinales archaeon]
MVMPHHTGTEGIETSIGGLWEERESLRSVGFMRVPNTFSGLQPPTTVPNIYSVYRPLFNTVSQRLARGGELGYKQYFDIEHASNNLHSLLNLFNYTYQDKTSSTYPISDLLSLERHYIFRNRSEVVGFAVNNSFLLQPLHEAYKQIRNYFGESAQAVLEVVADPEFFEDQELVIFIRTDLSPDEALEKLEQIDDKWWLNVPANVRKKLCITVEFI